MSLTSFLVSWWRHWRCASGVAGRSVNACRSAVSDSIRRLRRHQAQVRLPWHSWILVQGVSEGKRRGETGVTGSLFSHVYRKSFNQMVKWIVRSILTALYRSIAETKVSVSSTQKWSTLIFVVRWKPTVSRSFLSRWVNVFLLFVLNDRYVSVLIVPFFAVVVQ